MGVTTSRYRRLETNPVQVVIATAQAANIGDLVAYESSTLTRAEDESWISAIATPSAPTVADSGVAIGSNLTNAATGVKVSYQFPWGEGTLSTAGSATPTLHAAIKMTAIAIPSPAIGLNVYVETSAGSGTYELYQSFLSGGQGVGDIMIVAYGAGQAPPGTPALQDATTLTQYNFASHFLGVCEQTKAANATQCGTGGGPANRIRVSTTGVFLYAIAAASLNVGQYVAPAKATGNTLLSQTVASVAHPLLAVGRVEETMLASNTSVLIKIFSRNQLANLGAANVGP